MNTTRHYQDRQERLNKIKQYIGVGNNVATVRIDRGHANGAELHTVTDTAVVFVRNEHTQKLITVLVARRGQLTRLGIYDEQILRLADEHESKGYNYF